MVFLDEIDKKLTMIGQGAIQKTKEVSDTAKIGGIIKNLENQKKDYLVDLGAHFLLNHRRLANEQENILINKIESINSEILQYQEKLSKLKGFIYCPECNTEIPSNSLFCNVCGAKIEKAAPCKSEEAKSPAVKICRNCQAPLDQEQIFCTNCGTRVEEEKIITDEVPIPVEQQPVKEEIHQEEDIIQETSCCPNCGKEITKEQSFCIYCGTVLI